MSDIPCFADALTQFRQFLRNHGHADDVLWVFRDNLFENARGMVLVNFRDHNDNELLAQHTFDVGRSSGLVKITAVASFGNSIATTVWTPKTSKDEIQGLTAGLLLAIADPLPSASKASHWQWWLISKTPAFRRYQQHAGHIPTCAWASS